MNRSSRHIQKQKSPSSNWIWGFFSVVLGIVEGAIVVMIMESVGHSIIPMPADFDPQDLSTLTREMITPARIWLVVAAWAIGTFCGAILTSMLAPTKPMLLCMIVGLFFFGAGLFNLIMIPSPIWFWCVGLSVFFPAAWLGGKLGQKI